jgi:ABC-type transporter Mla maintaining outer membrane lipid asymmetry permease subunit MlaE
LACAVVVSLLGAGLFFHYGSILERYGGETHAVRIVVLALAREWGPVLALVATSVSVTAHLHARTVLDAQRSSVGLPPSRPWPRGAVAAVAWAAAPLAYVPACALGLVGAFLLSRVYLSVTVDAFFAGIAATLAPTDIVFGLALAAVYGVAPACWVVFGRALWGSSRNGGAVKLVTVSLAALGVGGLGTGVVNAVLAE